MADFFPSKECASHFGGLFTAATIPSGYQVIEDSLGTNGEVQLSLASFLKQFKNWNSLLTSTCMSCSTPDLACRVPEMLESRIVCGEIRFCSKSLARIKVKEMQESAAIVG